MFRMKDNVDAILEFSIRPIYPTWVLILIPMMWGACLAEEEEASAIMRVLFLISVMYVGEVARFRDMSHKSSMGIIFNTRDVIE